MDHVLAKVKGLRKQPYFKLILNNGLFEGVQLDVATCVPCDPDHNLDEDAWFKVEGFSQKVFCLDLLKS